jgi:hypothetical protein
MKKRILLLTTAILMIVSISFATNKQPVPQSIVKVFDSRFKTATNVDWTSTANYFKASFTSRERLVEVFYSFEGELIAVSRRIIMEQLPESLIEEMQEKSSNYRVTDLFELSTDGGMEYFVTLENEKEKKTFKGFGNTWTRYYQ